MVAKGLLCAEVRGRGSEGASSTSSVSMHDDFSSRDAPRESGGLHSRLSDSLSHSYLRLFSCAGDCWVQAGRLPRGACCSASCNLSGIWQVCAVCLVERVRCLYQPIALTCACADVLHLRADHFHAGFQSGAQLAEVQKRMP